MSRYRHDDKPWNSCFGTKCALSGLWAGRAREDTSGLKMLMKTRLTTWTAGGNDFRWEALMKFNQSSNRLVSFVHDCAYSIPIGPRIFESLNLLQWIMCRKPLHFYTMHVYVYVYIYIIHTFVHNIYVYIDIHMYVYIITVYTYNTMYVVEVFQLPNRLPAKTPFWRHEESWEQNAKIIGECKSKWKFVLSSWITRG